MSEFLTSVVSVVIVLGIMILVHEWGHFLAARLFGVRVDIFSIGFGPRIWGRKRGDTDYRISALVLGGYVKMAGDNPSEERTGDPAEFLAKPRWQRALIAVAGPAMNILMAILLLAVLFGAVGQPTPAYYEQTAEVAAVAKNSLAEKQGIVPGDRLVDVSGVRVSTWGEALGRLGRIATRGEIWLAFEREGATRLVQVPGKVPFDVWDALGYPRDPVIIGTLSRGMPAEAAGMRVSDQIVGLNGTPIVNWVQCVMLIRQSRGEPLSFDLKRGEQVITVQVRPVRGRNEQGEQTWLVGLRNRPNLVYKRLGALEAVRESAVRGVDVSGQIVVVVGQLVMGKVSLREMQGVVGIAVESGQAAQRGLPDVILLMAVISLNLGILNLLPIPILDGGHLLLLSVEGALRRDLSLAVKERFVQLGMVFLLVIFAIVMYNDVLRILPHR